MGEGAERAGVVMECPAKSGGWRREGLSDSGPRRRRADGQRVHGGNGAKACRARAGGTAIRVSVHGPAPQRWWQKAAESAGGTARLLAGGVRGGATISRWAAGHRRQVHGRAHGQSAGRRTGGGCAGLPGLSVLCRRQAGKAAGGASGAVADAHSDRSGRA